MKTYVVHASDYMGVEPEMYSLKAATDKEAILEALGVEKEDLEQDYDSYEDFLEQAEAGNGDGQPFTTIFCVEDNQVIFGEYP